MGYQKDEPNDNLVDSESFKVKITGNTPNNGNREDVKIIMFIKMFKEVLEKS